MSEPTTAAAVLDELRSAGVCLWPQGDSLKFRGPKGVLTQQRLEVLRRVKADVLALLSAEDDHRAVPDPQARHEPFPLTDVQAAYLLGRSGAFAYGGVACHGYLELTFPELEPRRLETAWYELVERHDMLRAIVHPDGYQEILPAIEHRPIAVLDYRGRSRPDLDAVRLDMAQRIYDPMRPPLHELRITRTDDGDVLHLSIDLLIADYQSIQILLAELNQRYCEPERSLPELLLTFRDYVVAQRGRTQAGVPAFDRARAYWWRRLADLPPAPELPVLEPAAPSTFRRLCSRLDAAVWQGLCGRARARGLTPAGAVLSAYAEVIGRWSPRPRFTLNLTLLNRLPVHPDVDHLVGDFTSVNLLAVDRTAGVTFTDRGRALARTLAEDLDHRLCSGVEALRELNRQRGGAVLMPVVFTSGIGLGAGEVDGGELLAGGRLGYGLSQTPQVWIDCQVMERQGSLLVNWDVRDGILPVGVVEDAFEAFADLLDRLAVSDEAWNAQAPVELPDRQARSRARANDTKGPIPDDLLHVEVMRRARESPDRPAVITDSGVLTYGELLVRARATAAALQEAGAEPGDLVAIVMDKGPEQVVGVLGVLLAGAAYVPVDTVHPPARRAAMLTDAGARFVLTQSVLGDLGLPPAVTAIAVDLLATSEPEPVPEGDPDAAAYVIYTSGSTGSSKGVVVSHRSARNTVADVNRRFRVGPQDRVLGLAQLGFDLSVYDIFGLLAAGGALVLPDPARRGDPSHWAGLIERHGVTLWNSVPAQAQMLQHFLDSDRSTRLATLRLALLSGDWVPPALPHGLRGHMPGLEVIALGGATEAAIWSIAHPTDGVPPDACSVPYGIPLTNQAFHVLDEAMLDCPDWVPGELYIAGAGVASGYWADPERTAARFVGHPRTGERMYRTGDLGRYLPGGVIEFLGREDDQVKIRGHRIETAEIEAVLQTHPGVGAAAVVAHGEGPLDRRLAAFVRTATGPPTAAHEVGLDANRIALTARQEAGNLDGAKFRDFCALADRVALAAMARTLRSLGVFTDPGRVYSRDDVLAVAHPRHARLMRRWLNALTEGRLLRHDPAGYHELRVPNPEDADWAALEKLHSQIQYGAELLDYLRDSMDHLPQLVRGELDPLALLFPQGRTETALAAYESNLISRYLNRAVAEALLGIAGTQPPGTDQLRVLEVGAGVGGTSAGVLAALAEHRVDYHFTDISPFFVNEARERFARYDFVRYGLLDLNLDLFGQGFGPNSVDVVICANVLHNCRNIGETLTALSEVLAPGGRLVFIEATRENYPLMVSMEFKEGLSDFRDVRRDRDQTFLNREQWRSMLAEARMRPLLCLPDDDDPLACAGQSVFVAEVKTDRVRVTRAELAGHLAAGLPEYMIPSQIQVLDDLPLTANGKVDRNKLRNRLDSRERSATAGAPTGAVPQGDLECRIAEIWSDLLGHDGIGRDVDLYALGGDSLLVARLVGRMREMLPEAARHDWDSLLRETVGRPTVAGLAAYLQSRPTPARRAAGRPSRRGSLVALGATPDAGQAVRVLLHDGSGTLAPYRDLVTALTSRSQLPLIGLEAGPSYLDADPAGLIEALAAEYTQELLDSKAGAFEIVGYCMGGLLATEVARQLGEAGADVRGLTVISCYRIPYQVADELVQEYAIARLLGVEPAAVGFPSDEASIARALELTLRQTPGAIPAGSFAALTGECSKVGEAFTALAGRSRVDRLASLAAATPGLPGVEHVAVLSRMIEQSMAAAGLHRAEPYPGDITFLRQAGHVHFLPSLRADMTSYWRALCLGELRVADIGGDHFTCLRPPHVERAAALIEGCR